MFAAIERIPPYYVDHYPKEYSSTRALTTVCGPASGIFKKDNDRVILRLLRSLIFRSQKAKNFHHINFIFLCIVLSSSKCLAIVLARDSSLLIYLPATKLVQILLPLFIYQFATYRMPHATGHTIIPIGSRCNILLAFSSCGFLIPFSLNQGYRPTGATDTYKLSARRDSKSVLISRWILH